MADSENNPPIPRRLAAWGVLLGLTVLLTLALTRAGIPAAPLLGGIAAAAGLAVYGTTLTVKDVFFSGAQSLTGCIIARSISLTTLHGMLDNPILILAAVFSAIVFSAVLGWIMTIRRMLPGTTAIWGISPGAATPMILMSDAFGGDMRLVALMQYLRIVMVAATASLVAGFAGVPARTGTGPGLETLFHAVPWQPFVQTMVLALACLILGRRIRFPAACLLLALTVGAVLQNAELLAITLPRWLMLAAYTLIGWTIGLRFSKSVFVYAMHTLPRILAAILLMIATCAGVGALLHLGAGIDPLTAYLATSPGGVDYMAIIAATSGADLGFVMAIQTARMLLVMLLEPPLARLVAIQAQKRRPARENVTP